MRILAFLLLAALWLPAHAQLTKCIDERGRVHYTDKPIPGCKPTSQQPVPPKPPPPPAAKKDGAKAIAKAPPKPKPEPPPSAEQCNSARQQREWLMSDRAKEMNNREARIGQVNDLIRKCR
jgi:hypothetical protein